MRKIGSFLKEERVKKKLSLSQMEKDTKIKKEFIDLIEKGDWDNLPEYPVIQGFVKSVAKKLNIPEDSATAFLRRDYPFNEKKLPINPKPDLNLKHSVSPKIITIALSVLAVFCVLAYLVYQYLLYIAPPKLDILQPENAVEITEKEVKVIGKTDSDATLTVNNQQVLVSETGEFSDKISVGKDTKNLVFVSRSRYGKETVVVREIIPKLP